MTSTNPFRARLIEASKEGYLPARRTYHRAVATAAAPVPAQPVRTASPRAAAYAVDLLGNRDLAAEARPAYRARLEHLAANADEVPTLTTDQVSALIDTLKALPVVGAQAARTAQLEAGHYAVEVDDTLVFVKVDRPTEGRWAGYTFITRQLSDEYVRMPRALADRIKLAIAEDPKAAAIRYGHELGKCAICGRTLTNEASRAAGIGPKCAAGKGW